MRKKLTKSIGIFAFLLINSLLLNGQATINEKIKLGTFDEARSLEVTSDGGYALTGVHTNSLTGNEHIYLLKTDDMGQEEFTKAYGLGSSAAGNRVEQTSDGGFLIAGRSNGSTSSSGPQATLVKTTADGAQQWIKHYGDIGPEEFYAVAEVAISPALDPYRYFACGVVFTGDSRDVFVAKVAANGNLLDAQIYDFGGAEVGYSILEVPGGFLIAGSKIGTTVDALDVLVMKVDYNLNLQWSRTYGGAGKEEGLAMTRTQDGYVAISGISNSFSNGREDIYLIKIDAANGALQWSRIYGRRGNEFSSGIVATADGGLVLTGGHTKNPTSTSEGYLLKVDDDDGSIKWDYKFGENNAHENFFAIESTPDGGFAMAGQVEPLSALTVLNKNIWLTKTGADGTGACETGLNFLTLVPPSTSLPILGIQAAYGNNNLSLQYSVVPNTEIRSLCCTCDDIAVSFTSLFGTSCFLPTPGIAVGSFVQFINTSDCATRFKWFINDMEVSTDENYTWVPNRPGKFEITLKGKVNGCSFISFSQEFTVYPGCYCPSAGLNSGLTHLNEFCFGGDCNLSGDDGGYAYFPINHTAMKGVSSVVSIAPLTSSIPSNVYARVWIDYNQDEVFDAGAGELAFDVFGTGPFSGFITPPLSAMEGPTLMRVQVKSPPSVGTGPPAACETFSSGEVEDYILTILPARLAEATADKMSISTIPNPATNELQIKLDLKHDSDALTLQLIDLQGRIALSEKMGKTIAGSVYTTINVADQAAGIYQLIVSGDEFYESSKVIVAH